MAGSAGSIYVDLLLRDAKYTEGWNRARSTTKSSLSGIQSDLNKTGQALSSILNPINNVTMAVQQLGLSVAGALSVDKIIKYSDTWKQISGRLSLVTSGTEDLANKQEQLFRIAQETRQPLEGIINFYSRLNQFIPEAERGQYDLLGVTQSVATALAITGETAISAQAALIQFTQGIGTNFEAAGQELRSLQELAPRLTQALQSALGGGTKSLQELVKAGTLTRSSVLNALSGMGVEGRKLKEEMAKIPTTVAQSFTQLDNALLKFLGTSDGVSKSTSSLAVAIKAVADNLEPLARALTVVAAVAGGAIFLKLTSNIAASGAAAAAANKIVASSAVTTAALVAGGIPSYARTAATITAMKTAATSLTAVRVGVFATALGGLKTVASGAGAAFMGLASVVGGPLVLAFGAAYAALEYFADKNKAVVAEVEFRKAIADTSAAMASYANQSKDSQQKSLWEAQGTEGILEAKKNIADLALAEYNGLNLMQKGLSEFYGTLGKWTGKDFSMSGAFGVGQTQEELQQVANSAENALAQVRNTIAEATKVVFVAGDGARYTKQQLEDAAKYTKEYGYAIQGITKEQYAFNQEKAKLDLVLATGGFGDPKSKEALKLYNAELARQRKALYESTPAFKAAQKHAEELKSAYEQFRPAILGVSKEQDTFNQNMEKAALLFPTKSGEAYNRILKEQIALRDEREESENKSAYSKYEEYITGLTEKEIKLRDATKEINALVGKNVESGIFTQANADTAVERYKKSLDDGKTATEEWGISITDITKKASENMQDAFADFLFDPFKDGLKGMVDDFSNALQRMAANAVSQQLFKSMLGGSTGDSGWLGSLVSGVTSLFSSGTTANASTSMLSTGGSSAASFLAPGNVGAYSGIKMYANGGFISPGQWGIAGEAGAELVYGGNTGATVIPHGVSNGNNGGTTLVMNISTPDANSFRSSSGQIAAQGAKMMASARRNM